MNETLEQVAQVARLQERLGSQGPDALRLLADIVCQYLQAKDLLSDEPLVQSGVALQAYLKMRTAERAMRRIVMP